MAVCSFVTGVAVVLGLTLPCWAGSFVEVSFVEYEPKKLPKDVKVSRQLVFQFHFKEQIAGSRQWTETVEKTAKLRSRKILKLEGSNSSAAAKLIQHAFHFKTLWLHVSIMAKGSKSPFETFNTSFPASLFQKNQYSDHHFYSVDYPYSSMALRVVLRCRSHYFGFKCSKFCRPQNGPRGHYECSENGEKICLEGWLDATKNCSLLARPCGSDRPCRNGGTCQNAGPTRSKCLCPPGWAGPICAEDRDECLELPCRNGGQCRNRGAGLGYDCDCLGTGFEGKRCEEDENECVGSPCRNNGTCTNLIGGFSCFCEPPYFGTQCSQCNESVAEDGFCPGEPSTFALTLIGAALISMVLLMLFCLIYVVVLHFKQRRKRRQRYSYLARYGVHQR